MEDLGKALRLYADDHADRFPDRIADAVDCYTINLRWLEQHVVYLGKGKTLAVGPDTALEYDKTMLKKGTGTLVLFAESRVNFKSSRELEALGIRTATEIRLPEDLERIIRANTRSFVRLRSARATIYVQRSRAIRVNAVVKGTLSWQENRTEWFDGPKARVDTRVTPDPGWPAKILLSEVEDGAHYATVPSDMHQVILTQADRRIVAEANPEADRDGQNAWIMGSDPIGVIGGFTLLHRFMRFADWMITLEQYTRYWATQGDIPTIDEVSLDGESCLLLEWRIKSRADGSMHRVWVVPAKGYCITKYQSLVHDRLIHERVAKIEGYGNNLFWYRQAENRTWFYDGTLSERTVARLSDFHPNVPVDSNLFTLAGLGIPPGTRIQDNIARLDYRYRVSAESGEAYLELDR